MLVIIILAIVLCRKRFKRLDTDASKGRQYQELPAPTDVDIELEQTDPSNEGPGIPDENLWSNEFKATEQKKRDTGVFYSSPLRNSEASGYCSLSEDGVAFEFKSNRTFSKTTAKKPTKNEEEKALEYTELLTVV